MSTMLFLNKLVRASSKIVRVCRVREGTRGSLNVNYQEEREMRRGVAGGGGGACPHFV